MPISSRSENIIGDTQRGAPGGGQAPHLLKIVHYLEGTAGEPGRWGAAVWASGCNQSFFQAVLVGCGGWLRLLVVGCACSSLLDCDAVSCILVLFPEPNGPHFSVLLARNFRAASTYPPAEIRVINRPGTMERITYALLDSHPVCLPVLSRFFPIGGTILAK